MNKSFIAILFLICTMQTLYSQEDGVVAFKLPVRNSLKFNRFTINPAFSFVREQSPILSFYNKKQWVQFDNAPQTYLFSYSGRFLENEGASLGFFQQDYGVLTTFGAVANFAHNIRLQEDSNLTFGINLGFYKSGLNKGKVITNYPDPSLENIPSNSLITVNPGINYGTAFLDFGLSVNNLVLYNLKTSEIIKNDPEKSIDIQIMYTGFFDSYGFFDGSKFSSLLKAEVKRDKTIISGLAMLTLLKGIWVQGGYNSLYGLSGGLGLNITPRIVMEYNYERGTGNLSNFGSSHEIVFAYKFKSKNYDYGDDEEEGAIIPASGTRNRTSGKPLDDSSHQEYLKYKEQKEAQIKVEAKLKEEQQLATKAKVDTDAKTKLLAAAKLKADADAITNAKLAQETRLKAEADAKAKLLAAAKLKADAATKAKLAEETRLKAEADAKAKLLAAAKLKADADAASKTKVAEETRLNAEADAKAKLLATAKLKAEADAATIANLAEETRLKAEADAKAKLLDAAKLEAEADAVTKAKLAEETRLKAEADAKAKLAEETRLKAEADAKAKLLSDAKLNADADAASKTKLAEEARLKAEADAKAKQLADAKLKADAATKAKLAEEARLASIPKDENAKSIDNLTKIVADSKKGQQDLLIQLNAKVSDKENDLKELKEENDLSDKGIYKEPKVFKSVSAENAAIESLKAQIVVMNQNQKLKIIELDNLYKERIKKGGNLNEETNQNYLKTIEALKLDQAKATQSNLDLLSILEKIKVDTEIEKKRRIKRAAFANDQDRHLQDVATLKSIKEKTPYGSTTLKESDFDFGEEQSNVQVLKDIKNVEKGYYLVIAVHSDVAKRDDFLTKAVASGQSNIDFFYDVKSGKYFIYYDKFDSIEEAKNALQSKGDKPLNRKMSMVKIEN